MKDAHTITNLLAAWQAGEEAAVQALLPAVYEELRKTARGVVYGTPDPDLSPTELVHEAFLRLSEGRSLPVFENRKHFYVLAAKLMRLVLLDQARRRRAAKRDPNRTKFAPEQQGRDPLAWNAYADHLALHICLEKLEEFAPRKARIVELRFFGGLELTEIADHLGLSLATVKRELLLARTWMAKEFGLVQR
jgi:RNA polymerase sigma factor (TIGR02999 family)